MIESNRNQISLKRMSKNKMIAAAALALGAVACEPLPVYPEGPGPYRRPMPPRGQQPPYGDERFPGNQGPVDGSGYSDRQAPLPPTEREPRRSEYPTAERTENPNRVISPYPPYNVIDVEGFRAGQLAKDPSNGKIFRVP